MIIGSFDHIVWKHQVQKAHCKPKVWGCKRWQVYTASLKRIETFINISNSISKQLWKKSKNQKLSP